MSHYYERIATLSEPMIKALCGVLDDGDWKDAKGKNTHYTAWTSATDLVASIDREVNNELADRWAVDRWIRAWFVNIPSQGFLHRHNDEGKSDYRRYHIPIQTNELAISTLYDDEGEHPLHLELGGIYSFNYNLDHSAVNPGPTDRIHLIVDVWK